MSSSLKMLALASLIVIGGCASRPTAQSPSAAAAPAPASAQASATAPRIVKSKNGTYDGEVFGTPAPNCKFAKLKIGMTYREVNSLIGAPDDIFRHETGKRWIPFYFGNDAQRMQA